MLYNAANAPCFFYVVYSNQIVRFDDMLLEIVACAVSGACIVISHGNGQTYSIHYFSRVFVCFSYFGFEFPPGSIHFWWLRFVRSRLFAVFIIFERNKNWSVKWCSFVCVCVFYSSSSSSYWPNRKTININHSTSQWKWIHFTFFIVIHSTSFAV